MPAMGSRRGGGRVSRAGRRAVLVYVCVGRGSSKYDELRGCRDKGGRNGMGKRDEERGIRLEAGPL